MATVNLSHDVANYDYRMGTKCSAHIWSSATISTISKLEGNEDLIAKLAREAAEAERKHKLEKASQMMQEGKVQAA